MEPEISYWLNLGSLSISICLKSPKVAISNSVVANEDVCEKTNRIWLSIPLSLAFQTSNLYLSTRRNSCLLTSYNRTTTMVRSDDQKLDTTNLHSVPIRSVNTARNVAFSRGWLLECTRKGRTLLQRAGDLEEIADHNLSINYLCTLLFVTLII